MFRDNTEGKTLKCTRCDADIPFTEEYALLADGAILCLNCHAVLYPTCGFCGRRLPADAMKNREGTVCCPVCDKKLSAD